MTPHFCSLRSASLFHRNRATYAIAHHKLSFFERVFFGRWLMCVRSARTGGGAIEKVRNGCVCSKRWDEGFQGRAQRIPTSSVWRGTSRAGREPLRRVRSFGSVTTQAPKKVRRPCRDRSTETLSPLLWRGVLLKVCDARQYNPHSSPTGSHLRCSQLCRPSSASCTPLAPSRRVQGKGVSSTTCLRNSSHWILKALS